MNNFSLCVIIQRPLTPNLISSTISQRQSSPHSSPHTQVSRPCHRTACPAGGDDSSCNRSSWSGRVYPWLSLLAGYGTEPRHTSHRPLKWEERGGGVGKRGAERRRVEKSKIYKQDYSQTHPSSYSALLVLITVIP